VAAGVTSVGRYLGWDGEPGHSNIGKNLSLNEARLLRTAGIEIFLAFEYLPDAPARGAGQGKADGQLAQRQLSALGAPPSMGVYFACDFDIPDYAPAMADTPANAFLKLGPVGLYFQAIKNLKYPYQVGVYGGYYAVKRVLDAGLATLGWQTVAWSGGQQDIRAVLYQVLALPPIVGADIDVRQHASTQSNYGQWGKLAVPSPPSPPSPPPIPRKEHTMIILKVTAPTGAAWTGTRTYLYSGPPGAPQHIVSSADQGALAAALPTITVTWNQFVELGGV